MTSPVVVDVERSPIRLLILGDVKFETAQIPSPKVIFGLTFSRFNHRRARSQCQWPVRRNPLLLSVEISEGDSSRLRNQIPGYECTSRGCSQGKKSSASR